MTTTPISATSNTPTAQQLATFNSNGGNTSVATNTAQNTALNNAISLIPTQTAITPTQPVTTTTPTTTPTQINTTSPVTNPTNTTNNSTTNTSNTSQTAQPYDLRTGEGLNTQPVDQTKINTTLQPQAGYMIKYDSNDNAVIAPMTAQDQQDALQATQNKEATDFSTAVTNIENGTTPLNAGEQAQVDQLKQQYADLIQKQGLANTSATGAASTSAARMGSEEYSSASTGNIASVVNAGAQKLSDLQTQESSDVSKLTEALQNNDIAQIKEVYDAISANQASQSKTLQDTIDTANAAITAKNAELQKQADAFTASQTSAISDAAKNGAPASVINAMQSATNAGDVIAASGGYMQTSTDPTMNDYLIYSRQATAQGLTPTDFETYKSNEQYQTAYSAEEAKTAADLASGTLTTQQNTAINTVNTELNNNSQVKQFQEVASNYSTMQSIPNGTTDPTQQAILLTAMAHIVSPGSNSLRGALNAIPQSELQSGIYNTINGIERTFEAKGVLSPDAVNSLKAIAGSIYTDQSNTYNQIRSDAMSPLTSGRGINNPDQYVPNYSDLGTNPTSQANAYAATLTAGSPDAVAQAARYAIPGWTDAKEVAYLQQNNKLQSTTSTISNTDNGSDNSSGSGFWNAVGSQFGLNTGGI
jgi:hypothetical protein